MPLVRFLAAPALLAALVFAGHGDRRRPARAAAPSPVQLAPASADDAPSLRAGRLPDPGAQRRVRSSR